MTSCYTSGDNCYANEGIDTRILLMAEQFACSPRKIVDRGRLKCKVYLKPVMVGAHQHCSKNKIFKTLVRLPNSKNCLDISICLHQSHPV